MMDFPKAETCS